MGQHWAQPSPPLPPSGPPLLPPTGPPPLTSTASTSSSKDKTPKTAMSDKYDREISDNFQHFAIQYEFYLQVKETDYPTMKDQ
ncbi:hypothetical protein FRB99_008784, partial [Tulasnella sp. 403]